MVHALAIGLVSMGLGAVFSIPAVALGFWLQKTGKGSNRYRASIWMCILVVLFQQIWAKGLPYDLLLLIALFASTLGVYCMDIYWAVQQYRDKE